MLIEEKNKEVVRHFYEALQQQDFEAAAELCHPDLVFYFQVDTPFKGVEGFIKAEKGSFDALPDIKISVKEIFADGDKVAAYTEFSGTHTGGPFFGVPATGESVKASIMMFLRLKDGKIIEKRAHYDRYDALKQIGVDLDKYVQQHVKENF
jgi:steroid delta-isomerase-like uncharacterized protein